MEQENRNMGQSQQKSTGLGLNLGVISLDITLSISGINTLTDTLNQALRQTGGALTEDVEKVVNTIQKLGVEQLKQWAQQGGDEAKDAYNQLVSKLQEAADRGEDLARNMLNTLGENVSDAGQKMQDVSQKGQEGSEYQH